MGVFATKYMGVPKFHKHGPPVYLKGIFNSSKIALMINWVCLWVLPYKILHSTYYFQGYLVRKPRTKHVVTLHDMIPEDFPEFFPRSNPHFRKIEFLRNADRIVCVSRYTMERLAHHHPELISKARYIPLGVTVSPGLDKKMLRNRTILYVGKRGMYKDFATLLRAFSSISVPEPDLKILAVGTDEFSSEECALIEELGLVGKVTQKELNDEELERAYRTSLLVAVTSHVEGFGLPVIEAMANGALVVATDIPVFNEIAGGSFIPFMPGDSAGLASAIHLALTCTDEVEVYRKKGSIIASEYTWHNSLIRLMNLYGELNTEVN